MFVLYQTEGTRIISKRKSWFDKEGMTCPKNLKGLCLPVAFYGIDLLSLWAPLQSESLWSSGRATSTAAWIGREFPLPLGHT